MRVDLGTNCILFRYLGGLKYESSLQIIKINSDIWEVLGKIDRDYELTYSSFDSFGLSYN